MRLLIADDHDLLREMLRDLMGSQPDIEVETARDFAEAEQRVAELGRFDLILLDWDMPGMNGLAGVAAMQSHSPATRVAILSGTASPQAASEALAAGAAGYVPKTLTPASLIDAARRMTAGEQFVPQDFNADPVEGHPLTSQLSAREREVLERLTQGKSNKEIARELDIREPTVKLHVKTLFGKIGATNRTQAAMIAKEAGLF